MQLLLLIYYIKFRASYKKISKSLCFILFFIAKTLLRLFTFSFVLFLFGQFIAS